MKRRIIGLIAALLLVSGVVAAQGDLSVQVLRLLTRTNTWSSTAIQTFQNNVILSGDTPSNTTNKLYNIDGDLYFNGTQLSDGGSGPADAHNLLSSTHTDTLAASVARGSIIVANNTPKWAALAIGTTGKFLRSDGTDASWSTDASGLTAIPAANLTGTIAAISGVNLTNLNASNLASGTVPLARLSGITNTEIDAAAAIAYTKLDLAASVDMSSDVTNTLAMANGGTDVSSAAADTVLVSNGSSWVAQAMPNCHAGTTALAYNTSTDAFTCQALSVGSGTVTSVAASVPSILAVAGSPITTSGTLAITLANETQNTVFAGSNGGGSVAPTFRALVNADLPTSGIVAGDYTTVTVNSRGVITAGIATTDAATKITGTLARGHGGTGLTSASDDTTLVSDGSAWFAKALPNCTSGLNYATASNAFSCGSTVSDKVWLDAGKCQNATVVLDWSTPTANPGVGTCVTGSNTQKLVVDFADGANTLSIQKELRLPATFTSTVDVDITWYTTATSGDVVWQVATACVAAGETGDPSFNTASTVTDTAAGTTNLYNTAQITGLTITGCSASEVLYLKVFRDPTTGADTLAATARLVGVELTVRRTL